MLAAILAPAELLCVPEAFVDGPDMGEAPAGCDEGESGPGDAAKEEEVRVLPARIGTPPPAPLQTSARPTSGFAARECAATDGFGEPSLPIRNLHDNTLGRCAVIAWRRYTTSTVR
jgi:hypothetical protein